MKHKVHKAHKAHKASKEQVLTHSQPSVARSVADSLVIKDKNLFFVGLPSGRVPYTDHHGFGLYYQDCRWLDAYEFLINGTQPNTLMSSDAGSTECSIQMTNVKGRGLEKDSLSIRSEKRVKEKGLLFEDKVFIRNHGRSTQKFRFSVLFSSRFDDVFQVRSLYQEKCPQVKGRSSKKNEVIFRKKGVDETTRITKIHFSHSPVHCEREEAVFELELGALENWELTVSVTLKEEAAKSPKSALERRVARSKGLRHGSWLERMARVETSDRDVSRILDRSFLDLKALRSSLLGDEYVSAGTPWFATLFGRDSLITALELLPFDRDCAADTLRLLAAMQAQEKDDYRDAEPGKILHEMRVGELARAGKIPHTPYYGTVDATPLFLLLLGRHANWEGSTSLFEELRPHVSAALRWIDHFPGFVSYDSKVTSNGLVNQGWKDAGNSILDESGGFPCPPIALVEVQAYVYEAKLHMADLFARVGEKDRAEELRLQAENLKARLNQAFWSKKKKIYGMALQKGGKLIEVVSSNAGHALFTGAADPAYAALTVKRLMEDDMFAGWGVRTLSSKEDGFNPMGYHLGTIWPHENALLAEGFRKYGFDEEALQIFDGITEAATYHRDGRLPEVFSGFSRSEMPKPVRYPVACSPQAWAAGSYPHLLSSLLGLRADAFHRTLEVDPVLPPYLEEVRLKGLRVGEAELDLEFRRKASGVECRVIRQSGDVRLRQLASQGREYPLSKAG